MKVKIVYGDDMRRWRYPESNRFAALKKFIKGTFKFSDESSFFIQFADDEGDRVTITSERDFNDAFTCAQQEKRKSLKIFVNQGVAVGASGSSIPSGEASMSNSSVQSDENVELPKEKSSNGQQKPEPDCAYWRQSALNFLENKEIQSLLPQLVRRVIKTLKNEQTGNNNKDDGAKEEKKMDGTEDLDDDDEEVESKPKAEKDFGTILTEILNEKEFKVIAEHELVKSKLGCILPFVSSKFKLYQHMLFMFNEDAIIGWIPHLTQILIRGLKNFENITFDIDIDPNMDLRQCFPQWCAFVNNESVGGNNNKAPKETLHNGVACDECDEWPIKGARYKCAICENYDLCSKCEAAGKHNPTHPLIKFTKEISSAEDYQFGGLHETIKRLGGPRKIFAAYPPPHHGRKHGPHGHHGPHHHGPHHHGGPHHGQFGYPPHTPMYGHPHSYQYPATDYGYTPYGGYGYGSYGVPPPPPPHAYGYESQYNEYPQYPHHGHHGHGPHGGPHHHNPHHHGPHHHGPHGGPHHHGPHHGHFGRFGGKRKCHGGRGRGGGRFGRRCPYMIKKEQQERQQKKQQLKSQIYDLTKNINLLNQCTNSFGESLNKNECKNKNKNKKCGKKRCPVSGKIGGYCTRPRGATNIKCICGERLDQIVAHKAYPSSVPHVLCDICNRRCDSHSLIYHCPNTKSLLHPNGYDICSRCAAVQETSFIKKEKEPKNGQNDIMYHVPEPVPPVAPVVQKEKVVKAPKEEEEQQQQQSAPKIIDNNEIEDITIVKGNDSMEMELDVDDLYDDLPVKQEKKEENNDNDNDGAITDVEDENEENNNKGGSVLDEIFGGNNNNDDDNNNDNDEEIVLMEDDMNEDNESSVPSSGIVVNEEPVPAVPASSEPQLEVEVEVEEPQPAAPAPVVPKDDFIYLDQLEQVKTMGFPDNERVRALLVQHKGNLERVITALLQ